MKINQTNLVFVDNKFREIGITLPKQELKFATKMFERKGRALGIGSRLDERDKDGNYFKYHRLINQDTGEVDEYVWDIYINQKHTIRNFHSMDYGNNIKDFIMKSQNHLMTNQDEEKFSVKRSNEVSRQIRSLNEIVENKLSDNTYLNNQILSILVKKIFKIDLDNHDITTSVRDRNFVKYFFSCESLITSDKLFWIVFDVVYSYSNFNELNLQDWERVLSRYDRLSNDEYYAERCRKIKGDIVAKHSKNYFKESNLNEYITMYRGFLVKPNRYVRKGIKKLNNSKAHIQDEGRGFSYTLDKPQAIRFASRYHFNTDFEFRRNLPTLFGSMSYNKTLKNLKRDYKKVLGAHYNQNYLDVGTRRCVGTFRIKKKHIIKFDVLNSESEIFADPNNVELIRYDFVNDEQDAQSAVWNVRKKPAVEKASEECLLELMKKSDYYRGIEKYLKDLPIELIEEFKDPTMTIDDYKNLHQDFVKKVERKIA